MTKKTFLHEEQIKLGAKMVEFAGYHMPIQYPQGIIHEHMIVREKVGVFDVSHMGNFKLFGEDRFKYLERMVVADVVGLKKGNATLSVIMNKKGGVVDDTIITNMGDYMYMPK